MKTNDEKQDYNWAVRHRKLNDTQKEDLCRRGHCKHALPCVEGTGRPFVPWSCAAKDGQVAYPPAQKCPLYEYDEQPRTEEDTIQFFKIDVMSKINWDDLSKTEPEVETKPKRKTTKKKTTKKK